MPLLLSVIPQLITLFGRAFNIDTSTDEAKLKMADLNLEAQKILAEQAKGQIEINVAEANAPQRKWISWRELVGYTCAAAFAYHFVLQQMLSFLFNAAGHPVLLPVMDISELMTVLMGMLGLGSLDVGKHVVDSVYNSPRGEPAKGRMVDGVWIPN